MYHSGDVVNPEGLVHVEAGRICVPSSQYCCELKTALKQQSL